jgi:hypothetical protein
MAQSAPIDPKKLRALKAKADELRALMARPEPCPTTLIEGAAAVFSMIGGPGYAARQLAALVETGALAEARTAGNA